MRLTVFVAIEITADGRLAVQGFGVGVGDIEQEVGSTVFRTSLETPDLTTTPVEPTDFTMSGNAAVQRDRARHSLDSVLDSSSVSAFSAKLDIDDH